MDCLGLPFAGLACYLFPVHCPPWSSRWLSPGIICAEMLRPWVGTLTSSWAFFLAHRAFGSQQRVTLLVLPKIFRQSCCIQQSFIACLTTHVFITLPLKSTGDVTATVSAWHAVVCVTDEFFTMTVGDQHPQGQGVGWRRSTLIGEECPIWLTFGFGVLGFGSGQAAQNLAPIRIESKPKIFQPTVTSQKNETRSTSNSNRVDFQRYNRPLHNYHCIDSFRAGLEHSTGSIESGSSPSQQKKKYSHLARA